MHATPPYKNGSPAPAFQSLSCGGRQEIERTIGHDSRHCADPPWHHHACSLFVPCTSVARMALCYGETQSLLHPLDESPASCSLTITSSILIAVEIFNSHLFIEPFVAFVIHSVHSYSGDTSKPSQKVWGSAFESPSGMACTFLQLQSSFKTIWGGRHTRQSTKSYLSLGRPIVPGILW